MFACKAALSAMAALRCLFLFGLPSWPMLLVAHALLVSDAGECLPRSSFGATAWNSRHSCSSVCDCGFLSCVRSAAYGVAARLAAAPLALASDGLWLLEPRVLRSEAACPLLVRALAPARVGCGRANCDSVDGCWHAAVLASVWPGAVAGSHPRRFRVRFVFSLVQRLPAASLIAWPWLLDPRVRRSLTALLAARARACAGTGFGCAYFAAVLAPAWPLAPSADSIACCSRVLAARLYACADQLLGTRHTRGTQLSAMWAAAFLRVRWPSPPEALFASPNLHGMCSAHVL